MHDGSHEWVLIDATQNALKHDLYVSPLLRFTVWFLMSVYDVLNVYINFFQEVSFFKVDFIEKKVKNGVLYNDSAALIHKVNLTQK